MSFATDLSEPAEYDRDDASVEAAEHPLALLAHLELVSADSNGPSPREVTDLDPPTPPLHWAAS